MKTMLESGTEPAPCPQCLHINRELFGDQRISAITTMAIGVIFVACYLDYLVGPKWPRAMEGVDFLQSSIFPLMIYPGIIVFAIGLINLLCIPMPWGKKGKLKKFSVQMISAGSEQPLDRWKDAAPAPPPLAATAFHPESERIPMEDDLGVLEPVEEVGALEEEEELDELEPIDDPVPVKAAPVVKQAPAPMRKVAPGVDRVPAAARVVAAGGPAVVVKQAVPLPKPVVGGPARGRRFRGRWCSGLFRRARRCRAGRCRPMRWRMGTINRSGLNGIRGHPRRRLW